jgi:hypothetical protein
MEKRTDIIQLKAPTKWEILKSKTKGIEQYLKGKFVKGTGFSVPKIEIPIVTKFDNKEFTRKYRERRKKINKISYASRRKNRSGL